MGGWEQDRPTRENRKWSLSIPISGKSVPDYLAFWWNELADGSSFTIFIEGACRSTF